MSTNYFPAMPHSSHPSNIADGHPLSQSWFATASGKSQSSHVSKKALLIHALDEIGWGVILVDAKGRIVHCNLAANVLLERADGIAVTDDVFQVIEPSAQSAFEMALIWWCCHR
jgi:hypothetical protein